MPRNKKRVAKRDAIRAACEAFDLARKPNWRLAGSHIDLCNTGNSVREVWIVLFENLEALKTGFEPSICAVEVSVRTGKAKVKRLL